MTAVRPIIRELGEGLVLRHATPADADALAAYNAKTLSDDGPDKPDERVGVWTHDLLSLPHPTFVPGDFTIVEDVATGAIVSSLNLIPQTWAYGGIPFGVGRPEVVSTLPEYRRRGLVRAQFEVIHQWSAERGHMLQAITGIPNYYRQFGYEMVLGLSGGRSGFRSTMPKLKEGAAEPYRVRPALEADLPFIADVYQAVVRRELVSAVRDMELWRYELNGRSPQNMNQIELRVVESAEGEPVGYLAHIPWLWTSQPGPVMAVAAYELKPGVSWLGVTPSVVRYLWAAGDAAAEAGQSMERLSFNLGAEHPLYEAFRDRLPMVRQPYAWFVRVPDLPAFVRHIAPALEERLAQSVAVGHSGELKLSFYRSGLRLRLERGRLAEVEAWQPTVEDGGMAGFSALSFLQLLFGYRTLDELRHIYADCWYNSDETRGLLGALFPKQASNVWGIS